MENKTIYLIRHGQTDYNKLGVAQGSGVDTSINLLGRAQAAAFYQAYKDVHFDKIYTSSLRRTVETVAPFIEKGVPYEQLSGLNEFSWGNKEGRPFQDEDQDHYLAVTNAWKEGDLTAAIEGGENPLQVSERQEKALELIMSRKEEKTILICMHGRAMRVLLCNMLNYQLSCMDTFSHSNTCLYKIVHTGSMFNVIVHNDVAHLCEINSKQFE